MIANLVDLLIFIFRGLLIVKVERINVFYIPPTSMRLKKLIVFQKKWCIYCDDWVSLFHICKRKREMKKKMRRKVL